MKRLKTTIAEYYPSYTGENLFNTERQIANGKMKPGMEERFGDMSWSEIASIARDLEIKISSEDEGAKKLEANLRMTKQVLVETMSNERVMRALSPAFYVKLTKTISRLEKQLTKYEAERSEFVRFINLLLHKLKKEKLIVTKVTERKREFGKHKGDV